MMSGKGVADAPSFKTRGEKGGRIVPQETSAGADGKGIAPKVEERR
jgi:hypothetical protein